MKILALTTAGLLAIGFAAILGGNLVQATPTFNDAIIELKSGGEAPNPPVDPNNPDNPVTPIDPDNPGTGNSGPLSIDFVPAIKFGTRKISSKTQVYSALNEHPYVQITDKTGSRKGWTLTATATDFISGENNKSKILKGAQLSFLKGETNTTSSNVSNAPAISQEIVFSNKDSQVVMNAEANAGRGTWVSVWSGEATDNRKMRLSVLPGSAEAGAYSSTITWTLVSGSVVP